MRRTKFARKPRALQFGYLRAELPQRVGDVADMIHIVVAEMNEDDGKCRPDLCKMAQWFQIAPFFAPRAQSSRTQAAGGIARRSAGGGDGARSVRGAGGVSRRRDSSPRAVDDALSGDTVRGR
ncbi:hypothetical protein [Burkholderia latens]|uniref:hypothetical protein n=1 Tax=Burkholderia latens TaxID=488446 RepID=UPI001FC896BF|nr:hypothetical protein [Burkholderia latens]